MILHHVRNPKGSAGFERLARYVTHAEAGVEPASWERLDAYIRDVNGEGDKVAWSRVSNCVSSDPGWAVTEIASTQRRNTRSQAPKNYHLVVSFAPGEKPTRETIEALEDRIVEALGFKDHQRISALHHNTENLHLHVAISKVHPGTFRNFTPWQDEFTLQKVGQELEIGYGLVRTNHTIEFEDKRTRALDPESFLAYAQKEVAGALLAARDAGKGWEEMHRAAAEAGVVLKPRGAGLVVGSADEAVHVKASQVDRGLSLKALEAKLGAFRPAGPPPPGQSPPKAAYERPGRPRDLYAAYLKERACMEQARRAALAALQKQHRAYARELALFYRARMRAERVGPLRGFLRTDSVRHVAHKRAQDREARLIRETAERKAARLAHKVSSWVEWIDERAAAGDREAQRIADAREKPQVVQKAPVPVEKSIAKRPGRSALSSRVTLDSAQENER